MSKKEKEKKEKDSAAEEKEPVKEEKDSSLQQALDEQKDRFLRLCADFENYKKRTKAEKDSTYANAMGEFAVAILPVVDNLERALLSAENDDSPLKKGVDMVYQQFLQCLSKLNITAYGENGEMFDPNIHEAVMHTEEEGVEANTITEVLQKGYRLGGKVLRPALVKVAN